MAARAAPADTRQLHRFVSTSPRAAAPPEDEPAKAADRLPGGPDAVPAIDDTAPVKRSLPRTRSGGPLKAGFAALWVRVADGPVAAGGRHLPGKEAWLVGGHRITGERKYYLSNLPPDAALETLAALIEARRVCEQMHRQMKDELGLDHFEGRSWRGLHHHALLCQLAFAFLQHLRLGGKGPTERPGPDRRPFLRCPHCRQREHHLRPWDMAG